LMEPRNRIRESPSHTIGDSFDLGGRNPFAGFLELVACGSLLTSVPGTGCGCGHVRGPQISRQISTSPDLTRPPQVHSLEFSGCSVVLREKIYHPFFFLCHFLTLVFFWFFFFGFLFCRYPWCVWCVCFCFECEVSDFVGFCFVANALNATPQTKSNNPHGARLNQCKNRS